MFFKYLNKSIFTLSISSIFFVNNNQFNYIIKTQCDNNNNNKDNKKNPFDCHNPVCNSKMDAFSKSLQGMKQSKRNINNSTDSSLKNNNQKILLEGCPIDKDELGISTWNLLHTLAAYYPDEPNEDDKLYALQFIKGLARFYPCQICADDFRSSVETHPPIVTSRINFSLWVCHLHNEVNEKLGKESIDCNIEQLDKRWKIGGKECLE